VTSITERRTEPLAYVREAPTGIGMCAHVAYWRARSARMLGRSRPASARARRGGARRRKFAHAGAGVAEWAAVYGRSQPTPSTAVPASLSPKSVECRRSFGQIRPLDRQGRGRRWRGELVGHKLACGKRVYLIVIHSCLLVFAAALCAATGSEI
jgi:hypothetical protein